MKIPDILGLPATQAAPLLLGCYLLRETSAGLIKVKLVETEAYHEEDPASHSFKWKTPRTAPMFEPGGRIYVYFTYGMHYCINIVTGQKGVGEAVLLRAAEPVEGIEIMQANRHISDISNLTNGPGKLAQALGIKSTELSGRPLGQATLWLEEPTKSIAKENIISAPRVGISQAVDLPWRFYIRDNTYVSKK